ncbi:hypothetical protein VNN41_09870 [Lactococcus garvieae]|uniref:hypothetical protein n=1 Tax=Lactococcus garvieae TaxID=1363 RepID=UPI00324C4030
MGFNYFAMAETVLKEAHLSMEDLGDYSARIHEFVLSATELINPKTEQHYSEQERRAIRLARQYFRDGRVKGGWDAASERQLLFQETEIEQEKKFAALGYSAEEIAERLGVSKSKVYKDGFRDWEKHGEVSNET